MYSEPISVLKIRNILLVTMPADPEDTTISAMQDHVMHAMKKFEAHGLILDISSVDTLDSFFARTVAETARMVALLGGRTVITGMRPSVAFTAAQLGFTLGSAMCALNVDRAFEILIASDDGG